MPAINIKTLDKLINLEKQREYLQSRQHHAISEEENDKIIDEIAYINDEIRTIKQSINMM